jgi:broad specificity phosphatase PhoE
MADTQQQRKAGRTVYIIRHGQTMLNVDDKIRSWLDIPLTDDGFEEAKKLGWELRNANIKLTGLFSSDLLRSLQTTLEISGIAGFPILGATHALRPWNVGTYAGKNGPTVHKKMMEYAENSPDKVLGGGESFNIFKYRVLCGIIGLLNSTPGILGLVSHSRGERILHAWVAAGCPENLDVDLDVFGERGEETASAQKLEVNCALIEQNDDEGHPEDALSARPNA